MQMGTERWERGGGDRRGFTGDGNREVGTGW